MIRKPLVTVYITNYNYGKYIQKAIESVLNQTYDNFEIFIIDDGSSDDSRKIIDSYSKKPQIKIIYQKNKGLIVSNNIALRLAQGKYIVRLDADDYFDENALLIMVDKLEKKSDLGLVFPNYYLVDQFDNIKQIVNREPINEVEIKDNPSHGACTMIRTEFLKQIGGYNEEFNCQDGYYLWINFISKYKVENINTPLFYYRQHGNNLTENKDKIFSTRSEINRKFSLIDKNLSSAVCIIPIRGPQFNSKSVVLNEFMNKTIIQWNLDSIIKSKYVSKIIVTSPDKKVLKYIETKYSNDKIILNKRDQKLAEFNSGLVDTIDMLMNNYKKYFDESEYFFIKDTRYPFINNKTIESAIKTIQIFQANSLISVRPDNRRFFIKTKEGLSDISEQENFTKLERHDLYRYAGGIIVLNNKCFKVEKSFATSNATHLIISRLEEYFLNDKSDFSIAEYVYKKSLK